MNAADEYICGIARKDLAAEVLKQAAADLRRFHGATSAVEREFYLDAYRWLTADDSSWPFSFLNVCHLLNLAPETVREELVGDMSLGAFSFWTRRCGRAASKLLSHIFTDEHNANSAESRTLAPISR
jgi:hypothetical protein